ncbi:hypothetical protein GGR58DRAFT_495005 [Xylaria digitata]|nr:hypothetical protein GGR58DRAFT_495005 [Xylaria digitata]
METSADSCRIYMRFDDWRPTDATIAELKNIGVKRDGLPSTVYFISRGPRRKELPVY